MACGTTFRTSALLLLTAALSAGPAAAGAALYMPAEELAARAPIVVEGLVTRTASGLDPETGRLATYVTLDVETVLRGPVATGELVLREAGGRYGDVTHVLDAVPVYAVGERVLTFLEPAKDGTLRTCGMFFGKWSIAEEPERGVLIAERNLEGLGRIPSRAAARTESVPLDDLLAVTAAVPLRDGARSRPAARLRPAELDRLLWDDVRELPSSSATREPNTSNTVVRLAETGGATGVHPAFAPMSSTAPARWFESDSDTAVTIQVQRSGNPLGDGAAAVVEIERAMAAWTDVPEARLVLETGNDDYDWTGTHSNSPANRYYGTNVILFDDPYDDISDPSGCSGVLAIGGYWRAGTYGGVVNNVTYYPAIQMYVIFNNDFECFLGDPDNLSEVAAHEMGHGIGFGHSVAPDAIMRSSAYGYRGPRLGEDDRDAIHCLYPHHIDLLSPNGGEVFETGSYRTLTWDVSPERGPDEGEVDLEYSVDGGQTWKTIATGTPNDGQQTWLVPDDPSSNVRVRVVRPHRDDYVPATFPDACSADASAASFSIISLPPLAGSVPSGPAGAGLTIEPADGGLVRLSWEPSCSGDVEDYAVYRGSLAALRSGVWDHVPVTCSAGPDLVEYLEPGAGSVYYLVAPLAGGAEGELGRRSDGLARPASAGACAPREADSTCE